MNETSLLQTCQSLPVTSFARDQDLLVEGENTGRMFVLISGAVEVLKQDVSIAIVEDPGALFGEIAALLGLPHMASVRALEDTRCHVIENPEEFLKEHPEIGLHLSRLLARRLNGLSGYLVDLKRQFEDHEDHLGMVDEVLESLMHRQPSPGK